jgi:hypothetical protein
VCVRSDVTVVNISAACDSEGMSIDSADSDPRKPYHHGSLRSALIEASVALAREGGDKPPATPPLVLSSIGGPR